MIEMKNKNNAKYQIRPEPQWREKAKKGNNRRADKLQTERKLDKRHYETLSASKSIEILFTQIPRLVSIYRRVYQGTKKEVRILKRQVK